MSELIQKNDNRTTIRWKLLASVSAAALVASGFVADEVLAADSDDSRPLVWIELGAQLERVSGGDSPVNAAFFSQITSPLSSPAKIERELPWALGPEAKISFQPEDSNWIFSAGVRYGRSHNHRDVHQQGKGGLIRDTLRSFHKFYYTSSGIRYSNFTTGCCQTTTHQQFKHEFSDVQSSRQERHLILDFQAGKDVGLGMFGNEGSSVVSAGVRIAQFHADSETSVKARADLQLYNLYSLPQHAHFLALYPQLDSPVTNFRDYSLTAGSKRDTKLVGPTASWEASAALAGNADSSELTFDWSVNAALLFGRQKAKTQHQSSGQQLYAFPNTKRPVPGSGYVSLYNHPGAPHTRSRSVTVPNVGGMAGFSFKWPDAKISFGYRADYFFGAMDGGWDTAKKENRSFMGPFASISFGLGD